MRRLRVAVPLALIVGLLLPTDASAAGPRIVMLNFTFAPILARPRIGQDVTWWNEVNNRQSHTATDTGPLGIFDSGTLGGGQTYTYRFTAAASYTYECTLHYFYGMIGTVGVRGLASPPTGGVGTVFTITVATEDAPAGMVYDIQKRNPSGHFQPWITGATASTATFDSTGQPTGVYSFRSRLRRLSDEASTGYSPAFSIEVTAQAGGR
jgi:plastocyanin